jgi:hypothetical protein
MKMVEMAPEIKGLCKLTEIIGCDELKEILREGGEDLFLIFHIACALNSGNSAFISEVAARTNLALNKMRVSAEGSGTPFYAHDVQHFDEKIGLRNAISLMAGTVVMELKEMLRESTKEERAFGMAPSVTVAECEYNIIGYFLAVLMKKLYYQLKELQARR